MKEEEEKLQLAKNHHHVCYCTRRFLPGQVQCYQHDLAVTIHETRITYLFQAYESAIALLLPPSLQKSSFPR